MKRLLQTQPFALSLSKGGRHRSCFDLAQHERFWTTFVMRRKRSVSQQGLALITAMAAAVIISLTAAVVMGVTWRRMEMSALRSDHLVSQMASEAGLQYAFARLDKDTAGAFKAAIQAKGANDYIIRCHDDTTITEDLPLIPALHVGAKVDTAPDSPSEPQTYGQYTGGKHVTIRIRYNAAGWGTPPDPARPYKITASSDFATGS